MGKFFGVVLLIAGAYLVIVSISKWTVGLAMLIFGGPLTWIGCFFFPVLGLTLAISGIKLIAKK